MKKSPGFGPGFGAQGFGGGAWAVGGGAWAVRCPVRVFPSQGLGGWEILDCKQSSSQWKKLGFFSQGAWEPKTLGVFPTNLIVSNQVFFDFGRFRRGGGLGKSRGRERGGLRSQAWAIKPQVKLGGFGA